MFLLDAYVKYFVLLFSKYYSPANIYVICQFHINQNLRKAGTPTLQFIFA